MNQEWVWMDTVSIIFAGMQTVFWVLSLFFMPGFVITLARFPWFTEIGVLQRLVYSVILSIIFTPAFILFMDILGVDPVPGNTGHGIAIFLTLMLIVWLFEVFSPGRRFQEWIAPRFSQSRSYEVIRRNFSRRLHAALDHRQASTTLVVYHESERSGRNQISHSWLLNVGREIAIQEIVEYKGKNSGRIILPPPHPKTRYIELAVLEYNDGRVSLVKDLQVYPVHVARNLPSSILGFTPKRGILDISGRIDKKTPVTEVHWIYTSDFHLLGITCPDDTLDQMVDRIIAKIDQIVRSLQCGIRVTSGAEDQRISRDAVIAVTEKPKPSTPVPVTTATFVKHPQIIAEPDESDCRSMQEKILSNVDMSGITPASFRNTDRLIERIIIPKESDINKRVFARIGEILDDDWPYT